MARHQLCIIIIIMFKYSLVTGMFLGFNKFDEVTNQLINLNNKIY